jgi:trehalose-6-phosphate synthase
MNLVSKEFVASRDDEQGALMLSEFAGAANELHDAVVFNPYDIDQSAATLASTLAMSGDEQRARMHRMRRTVQRHDAHAWASRMLGDVLETCRSTHAEKSRFSVTRVPSLSNALTSI